MRSERSGCEWGKGAAQLDCVTKGRMCITMRALRWEGG